MTNSDVYKVIQLQVSKFVWLSFILPRHSGQISSKLYPEQAGNFLTLSYKHHSDMNQSKEAHGFPNSVQLCIHLCIYYSEQPINAATLWRTVAGTHTQRHKHYKQLLDKTFKKLNNVQLNGRYVLQKCMSPYVWTQNEVKKHFDTFCMSGSISNNMTAVSHMPGARRKWILRNMQHLLTSYVHGEAERHIIHGCSTVFVGYSHSKHLYEPA